MRKIPLVVLLVLLVAACASNNVEPPAPLTKFTPQLKVQRVWDRSIGAADAIMHYGIVPASDGSNVYVAAHDGDVYAFGLQDGRKLWKVNTRLPLSAGPGVGSGMVVVGGRDGSVLALNAASGAQLWKTSVNGELLVSPAVDALAVVVHTTDGRTVALSPDSGAKLWSVSHDVPHLTLRGAGVPAISGGTLYEGLANGHLLALNLTDGQQRWDAPVSNPSGSNELARIVDMNGTLALDDSNVFAVTYQGQVADVARDSGQILWARAMSSYTGVSADDTHVYVSDVHGEVWALDKSSGTPVWTQPVLRARDLTVPVPYGNAVAVGDVQGYVHFLSSKDGSLIARVRPGSDPIQAPPLVANGLLVVLTTGGDLAVYRATPLNAGS